MVMILDAIYELDAALVFSAVLWILIAALIRGYTGFGSAAIAIAGLSMFLPPAKVIPLVLLLEIVAGIRLLPSVWRHIDWRQLRFITLGALLSTPIGVLLLATVPADTMRIVIYTLILIIAIMIGLGVRIPHGNHAVTVSSAGAASGVINGAAGIGGLPLVAFFLSKDENALVFRATLTAYLIGLDLYSCGIAGSYGLIDSNTLVLLIVLIIPLVLGISAGNRQFQKTQPNSFKRLALLLLATISTVGLLRTLLIQA